MTNGVGGTREGQGSYVRTHIYGLGGGKGGPALCPLTKDLFDLTCFLFWTSITSNPSVGRWGVVSKVRRKITERECILSYRFLLFYWFLSKVVLTDSDFIICHFPLNLSLVCPSFFFNNFDIIRVSFFFSIT